MRKEVVTWGWYTIFSYMVLVIEGLLVYLLCTFSWRKTPKWVAFSFCSNAFEKGISFQYLRFFTVEIQYFPIYLYVQKRKWNQYGAIWPSLDPCLVLVTTYFFLNSGNLRKYFKNLFFFRDKIFNTDFQYLPFSLLKII